MLKSQDIVVLCWLMLHGHRPWRYLDAASGCHLSVSECHAAVGRLRKSRLLSGSGGPVFRHISEFFRHGFRFVFFAEYGSVGSGVATGVAGPALAKMFDAGSEIPVWPHAHGNTRGYELKPLHPRVPDAALNDEELYAMLSLLDALRDGRARERQFAVNEMDKWLKELEQRHESARPEP